MTYINPSAIIQVQSTGPSTVDIRPLHNPLHGARGDVCRLFNKSKNVVVFEMVSNTLFDLNLAQLDDGHNHDTVESFILVGKDTDTSSLVCNVRILAMAAASDSKQTLLISSGVTTSTLHSLGCISSSLRIFMASLILVARI